MQINLKKKSYQNNFHTSSVIFKMSENNFFHHVHRQLNWFVNLNILESIEVMFKQIANNISSSNLCGKRYVVIYHLHCDYSLLAQSRFPDIFSLHNFFLCFLLFSVFFCLVLLFLFNLQLQVVLCSSCKYSTVQIRKIHFLFFYSLQFK